jgi:hypothetical protein
VLTRRPTRQLEKVCAILPKVRIVQNKVLQLSNRAWRATKGSSMS